MKPKATLLSLIPLPWRTIAQSTFPCMQFWPTLPSNDHGITGPCAYLPGYPTTISNIPISVIHTTDFDPSLVPLLPVLLSDTFDRTISTYSSLPLPSAFPEIVLLITNMSHPAYTLVTNQAEFPPAPCRIIGYSGWLAELSTNGATSPDDADPGPAQQKLAHEIYHCVQKWNLPLDEATQPFPSWIIEGSAMYFSNLAFPSVDLEWLDSSGYNPDVALYQHDELRHAGSSSKSAYATGLFFQSLEGVWGAEGINQFVLLASQANGQAGGVQERKRLSRDVMAIMGFERFAESFTLGRAFGPSSGLGIQDTNGRYIPTAGGAVLPATLVMTDAEGKEGKIDIATVPFTVSEFVVQVDGGQIVMVSLGSRPKGGKVKYRLGGGKEWLDLPTGDWGSKGFIVTECEESVSVFVLFVSTADVETDKATVLVKQFYKDESCPCKNGKKRKAGLKDGCEKKEEPKDDEDEEQSGSCAGSNIPTDECFMATRKWSLDIPSTKALVEKQMKETLPVEGLTGVVVGVTGSGGFEINGEDGKNVTMTYNNLNIQSVVTIQGMNFPVSVKIDGVAEAKMFTEKKDGRGSGSVCLVMSAGHGSVVGSNPLLGDVLRYDLSAKDWISQDWDLTYTCGGGKFSIHGVLNGATTFGPFVYNAIA
ncbi:hypothetical protein QBC37DRAFT_448457 [Rhypophila decipiens]|uniref:Uncharacterized protein n=1 Tax=Rhypophila decipiens TaxID=261697 RepID=A0AAN6Y186_9PEZI|nr:hypothetical protein QBC37DRAFT_448457 [Rhypophila decipiens]